MEKDNTLPEGIKIADYLSIKERLNKNPKEKTSISIDKDTLKAAQNCLKKEYSDSSLSRLVEMLLEDFLEFHHPEYLKQNKEESKKE